MSEPNFRPIIFQCRRKLKQGRERIRAQHDAGSPGIQVSAALTDLVDTVLLDLYHDALNQIGDSELESKIALVPNGGYGRRDVAPFSDVDLMLLYSPGTEERARPLAQRLTQDIPDVGLTPGFSLRSPSEAVTGALEDATIFTSLAESRYLAGSARLFSRYMQALRRDGQRRWRSLIHAIVESRDEEREKYGETVNLLMPHIKRSMGGLRDVQLVRWIGFARFGETDLRTLEAKDALRREDGRQLRRSHEFLLRIRNEMHFHSGKSQDVLDRDEQVRLADRYGYQGSPAVIPVEEFMRDYIDHTNQIRYASANMLATARMRGRAQRFLSPLWMHNVEGDFRVGPVHIAATRRGLQKVSTDLTQLMRMMVLASLYSKQIDHQTWEAMRHSVKDVSDRQITRDVIDRFLELMGQTSRLADLLRRLHELRVLELIVPGMRHARCLLQFNDYHKYTVDEHSIRTVEAATRFLADDGPVGDAYRGLKDKRALHLAALLHDLGKGYTRDHSEIGAELAAETAEKFGLPEDEAETLRYLVQKHLVMSHLAQFRDINDPKVITEFAADVGSADVLQMLYVLTAADLDAVGPGVLNPWKVELITQLYRSTRRELTGHELPEGTESAGTRRRNELRTELGAKAEDPWWARQIDALPFAYLYQARPDAILDDLQQLRGLARDQAAAWARYIPEQEAVEYTVGAYEDLTPGAFHRLTGVLTSQRNEIYSAEIHTLEDGLILDRFYVQDRDHEAQPPQWRLDDVCDKLTSVLQKSTGEPPKFPRLWKRSASQVVDELAVPRSSVRMDNSTSDRYTIVDVFAKNCTGLLYTITRELFEMGLSVHIAKIGTHLDQVVDVFYVTDQEGNKVEDVPRIRRMRQQLRDKIRAFEERQA